MLLRVNTQMFGNKPLLRIRPNGFKEAVTLSEIPGAFWTPFWVKQLSLESFKKVHV